MCEELFASWWCSLDGYGTFRRSSLAGRSGFLGGPNSLTITLVHFLLPMGEYNTISQSQAPASFLSLSAAIAS